MVAIIQNGKWRELKDGDVVSADRSGDIYVVPARAFKRGEIMPSLPVNSLQFAAVSIYGSRV